MMNRQPSMRGMVPPGPSQQQPSQQAVTWKIMIDPSTKQTYYLNIVTKEKSMTCPPDLVKRQYANETSNPQMDYLKQQQLKMRQMRLERPSGDGSGRGDRGDGSGRGGDGSGRGSVNDPRGSIIEPRGSVNDASREGVNEFPSVSESFGARLPPRPASPPPGIPGPSTLPTVLPTTSTSSTPPPPPPTAAVAPVVAPTPIVPPVTLPVFTVIPTTIAPPKASPPTPTPTTVVTPVPAEPATVAATVAAPAATPVATPAATAVVTAPAAAPLSPAQAWQEGIDPGTGVKYYFNVVTKVSTWTMPPELQWQQKLDPNTGVRYYFNCLTNESTWTAPPEVAAIFESEQRAAEEAAAAAAKAAEEAKMAAEAKAAAEARAAAEAAKAAAEAEAKKAAETEARAAEAKVAAEAKAAEDKAKLEATMASVASMDLLQLVQMLQQLQSQFISVKQVDPGSGLAFYYNVQTQQSTWTEPPDMPQQEQIALQMHVVQQQILVAQELAQQKGNQLALQLQEQQRAEESRKRAYEEQRRVEQDALAAKERLAKEQAAREQAAKEQAVKEQAAKEQMAKEQAQREQSMREQKVPRKNSAAEPTWLRHIDPKSGVPYYYNTVTKQSTWEQPADYQEPPAPAQLLQQQQLEIKEAESKLGFRGSTGGGVRPTSSSTDTAAAEEEYLNTTLRPRFGDGKLTKDPELVASFFGFMINTTIRQRPVVFREFFLGCFRNERVLQELIKKGSWKQWLLRLVTMSEVESNQIELLDYVILTIVEMGSHFFHRFSEQYGVLPRMDTSEPLELSIVPSQKTLTMADFLVDATNEINWQCSKDVSLKVLAAINLKVCSWSNTTKPPWALPNFSLPEWRNMFSCIDAAEECIFFQSERMRAVSQTMKREFFLPSTPEFRGMALVESIITLLEKLKPIWQNLESDTEMAKLQEMYAARGTMEIEFFKAIRDFFKFYGDNSCVEVAPKEGYVFKTAPPNCSKADFCLLLESRKRKSYGKAAVIKTKVSAYVQLCLSHYKAVSGGLAPPSGGAMARQPSLVPKVVPRMDKRESSMIVPPSTLTRENSFKVNSALYEPVVAYTKTHVELVRQNSGVSTNPTSTTSSSSSSTNANSAKSPQKKK